MGALFDPGREGILDRTIDVTASSVKVAPLSGYTFVASHKFLSDVTGAGGALAIPGVALTSKQYTAGALSAANTTLPAPPAGPAITSLLIFNDTGTPSTSRVIALVDSATGLPITPNGVDINVVWDTGANKIFKL
jgi:hypothetical protein